MPVIKMPRRQRCSICNEWFTEFGNNAAPINHGRCCDVCNTIVVIPARIARMARGENMREVPVRGSKYEPT